MGEQAPARPLAVVVEEYLRRGHDEMREAELRREMREAYARTSRAPIVPVLRRLTDAAGQYLTADHVSEEDLRRALWDAHEAASDLLATVGTPGPAETVQANSGQRDARADLIELGRAMGEQWAVMFKTMVPIMQEMAEGYMAALREAFPPQADAPEEPEEDLHGVPGDPLSGAVPTTEYVACGWTLGHSAGCGNWRQLFEGEDVRPDPNNLWRTYAPRVRSGGPVPRCGAVVHAAGEPCGHELRSYPDLGDIVQYSCGKRAGHVFDPQAILDGDHEVLAHGNWREIL